MHLGIFVQQLRGLDRVRELFYSPGPKLKTLAVKSDLHEHEALQPYVSVPTRKDFEDIRKLLVDSFYLGLSSGVLSYIWRIPFRCDAKWKKTSLRAICLKMQHTACIFSSLMIVFIAALELHKRRGKNVSI